MKWNQWLKLFVSLTFFLAVTSIEAQSTAYDAASIRATVELFFEGFHERNEPKMKSVLDEQAVFHSMDERGEISKLRNTPVEQFLQAVVSRPDSPTWEERLHEFKIEVDGPIAQAWVSYSFWLGGSFSHCGIDAFTLFKKDQKWIISYLIDSRKTDGCAF
ncbi:MAG: nuclear transport factor 2 family protein [Flavobacteriaceae bacterium]